MADAHVSAPQAMLNFDYAPAYENWLRTHADTAATGCGPLPPNATCPKWHPNQPMGAGVGGWGGAEGGGASDAFPNCYICCYGRPGFGCTPKTPTDMHGAIADVIPFDKNGYGSMPGSLTWTSASFVVANTLLKHTGDVSFLNEIYPFLAAHLAYHTRNADPATGLLPWDQYGDWNSLQPSSFLFLANAYYTYDAQIMASIAAATGRGEDAKAYLALAALVNDAVTHAYYNASGGFWDKGSQGAQAVALCFGLGSNATTPSAPTVAHLVNDIVGRGYHPTVGTLGSRWLLQALSQAGRGDVALALARNTQPPSWGAMLVGIKDKQPPLGTFWEGWDGPGGGSSGNHIMLGGGIGEWFYSDLLGLRFGFEAAEEEEGENQCDRRIASSTVSSREGRAPLNRIRRSVTHESFRGTAQKHPHGHVYSIVCSSSSSLKIVRPAV